MQRNCSYRFVCLLEANREERSDSLTAGSFTFMTFLSPHHSFMYSCDATVVAVIATPAISQCAHSKVQPNAKQTQQRELNELLGFHTELL